MLQRDCEIGETDRAAPRELRPRDTLERVEVTGPVFVAQGATIPVHAQWREANLGETKREDVVEILRKIQLAACDGCAGRDLRLTWVRKERRCRVFQCGEAALCSPQCRALSVLLRRSTIDADRHRKAVCAQQCQIFGAQQRSIGGDRKADVESAIATLVYRVIDAPVKEGTVDKGLTAQEADGDRASRIGTRK